MRNLEARIIRLEHAHRVRQGPPREDREQWDFITHMMAEIAQPEGHESLVDAWCRHCQISVQEFDARLRAGDGSHITEPINAVLRQQ